MPDLLTKEDIARELNPERPLTVRSVERYIRLAKVKPAEAGGGKKNKAKYSREDADKIIRAYRTAQATQQQERQQRPESRALTTTKPASVALVGEMARSQIEAFERLDPWPEWLTRAEALERSGVPPSFFDRARVPHIGHGRAVRYHRDDVRELSRRLRQEQTAARAALTNGAAPQDES
jgi:hypothetical protein